jgi:sulfonate transport system permease protein
LTSLEILRPLPAVAFLPVSLLLFNFSLTTELVLIVYASIWPAFINTLGGITSIPTQLHDVSRSLRLSRLQTITKVVLPAAAPAIVTGCRLSMGLTLVMAIIAEMLANPEGLGYAVVSELQAMQPQRMFAYVLYIGCLAILMNAILTWVSRVILHSHPHLRDSDA